MRLLPCAPDAERALLSAFMQAPDYVGGICAERALTTRHFHAPAHAILFALLMERWTANDSCDLISVTQTLKDRDSLDEVGGPGLVTEIFTLMPTASVASAHAEILEQKRILRDLIAACVEFQERAYVEQEQPEIVLSEATAKICAIASTTPAGKPKTPKELVQEAAERNEERIKKRGLPDTVMRTGIAKLDETMNGIRQGDYVLISGKEKSGKTTLAMNIFEHVVFRQNKRAFIASLEMKTPETIDRLHAAMGRVNLTNILNGWMSDEEATRYCDQGAIIAGGKFQLRDDLCSLGQIVAAFRQYKSQHADLEFGLVDYLQMIDPEKTKAEQREQAIAHISRTLRRLAQELNLGMIVLVQLNEDGQVRESRSPGMDCTAHIRIEPGKKEGLKWARVVYQRNGPANVGIPLTHLGQFVRFEEAANVDEDAPEPPQKKRNWHTD